MSHQLHTRSHDMVSKFSNSFTTSHKPLKWSWPHWPVSALLWGKGVLAELSTIWEVKWSEVKWSAQSCPTVCDPVDCSLPGFSVHWIFQARVLEWVALSFSRGSSWPRDRTQVSCIAGRCFTLWATREAPLGSEVKFKLFSVQLFVIPLTGACQAPLFMGKERSRASFIRLWMKRRWIQISSCYHRNPMSTVTLPVWWLTYP